MQKHLMAPAIATAMALSLGIQTSTARAQDASSASTAKMPESSGQQELSLADILDLRLSTIASGTIKPIAKAAAIATIITAKDIEAMGARTFEEALDKVPGLHVSNSAAIMSPKILVRGSVSTYNPEILVMINGVPFTSLVKGDRFDQLGVLPVSMISRIEVIRGPGSALYGAEALMGVINVITKSGPEINGTVAGYRSESFNTNVGWLQHGGIYGEHRYAVMANYMNSDGQKRVIERDALFGTATTRAPGPVALQREGVDLVINSEIGRWTFDGQYRSVSNGSGAGVADNLDPISTGVYQRAMLSTKYDNPNFTDDFRVEGRLAFSYASQEIGGNGLMLFPPGTNIGTGTFTNGMVGKPEYAQRMWYFDTSATYKSFKNHLIRLGVGGVLGQLSMVKEIKNFTSGLAPRSGYVDVTDTSEAFMPKKRRDNYHAILQDEWKFAKDWELTAGLRFDHFSDFGDTANPRLALVWDVNESWTSKLLVGRAFRSPNFSELYTSNNPVSIGNEFVRPETNTMYEWALRKDFDQQNWMGINFFHYEGRNIINFVKDTGSTKTAQNLGDRNGDGFELEGQMKQSNLMTLSGHYSYVLARDQATGGQSGDYPNQQAYLNEEWQALRNWSLNTQVRWIGTRMRGPRDTRAPLNGFTTVDLTTRGKKLFGNWEVALSVRNMFDDNVREPSAGPDVVTGATSIPFDYPQEGRSFYAEASLKW